MEDRKKTLKDLEASKLQTIETLDNLLANLGESLIARMETVSGIPSDGETPVKIWDEKNRLQKEIANAEENIVLIETDLRRLGELEEEINRLERERNEISKDVLPVYTELGRLVLIDSGFENFSSAFEKEMNDITMKIDYQQKKLDELDGEEGNIFIRATKGVRGMVNRLILTKNEAELEKLFRGAGEQFFIALENPGSRISSEEITLSDEGIIGSHKQKGSEFRQRLAELRDEGEKLRTERREKAAALDQKGNPARRISELEAFITNTKDEVIRVYRNFGACARKEEWRKFFAPFSETENIQDEKIDSISKSLHITEQQIEDVKIAIAIDNENAEISKLKAAINEKQQIINNAESAIAGMKNQIETAEKNIKNLSEKQHG